jgi:hypothetical protein
LTPSIVQVLSFFGAAGAIAMVAGTYAYVLYQTGVRVRWKPFKTFAVAPRGMFRSALVKKISKQKIDLHDGTGNKQSVETEILRQAKLLRWQVHVGFAVLLGSLIYMWFLE